MDTSEKNSLRESKPFEPYLRDILKILAFFYCLFFLVIFLFRVILRRMETQLLTLHLSGATLKKKQNKKKTPSKRKLAGAKNLGIF